MSILKSSYLLQNIWTNKTNENINLLSNDLADVLRYNKIYDQARIIDITGQELTRIIYSNNLVKTVPKKDLQNKKDRYYFNETLKIDDSEFYASDFDLNIEYGKIEEPIKPVVRFATPIVDSIGTKQGILVLNYLGQNILEQFDFPKNKISSSQYMLLNNEGYWLKSNKKDEEWAFMYPNKQQINFSNKYPDSWNLIKDKDSTQFVNKVGLFTVKKIYPLKPNKIIADKEIILTKNYSDYYWTIVSFVPYKLLFKKQTNRRKNVYILLFVFGICFLYYTHKLTKAQFLREKYKESLIISNVTKDKFFSIIAHDLRGSFHALMSLSDMLVEDITKGNTQEIKEYGKMINTSVNKNYRLLNNLLEWARSQTNQLNFTPETFNLFSLVGDIFEILKLHANEKEIQLKNLVPIDLKIVADKNMISTVIRNLLSNSIKFCNPKGTISVIAFEKNNTYICEIRDNGVGISNEILDKLLDLTSIKLTSTMGTNNEKGSGLGLILCKELIEKHQGEMGIKSNVGVGTTIWFQLPKLEVKKTEENA